MKNGGLMDLVLMGVFFVVLVCGALGALALKTTGEAVLPAQQVKVKNDPVQRIQPKGFNAQDDNLWMRGDQYLDQGYAARTVADAEAERLRAEACATRNDCYAPIDQLAGSFGGGILFAIFGVIVLLGLVFKRS